MAPDPRKFVDVRCDDGGTDAPCGERDQQIVHYTESVAEPASVAVQGPKGDAGTVEEIGRWSDQSLRGKAPLIRSTARRRGRVSAPRRSSMSTTEERKWTARCAPPVIKSACAPSRK